eukprot:4908373-Pleurochrysis_carterae.AAC.1
MRVDTSAGTQAGPRECAHPRVRASARVDARATTRVSMDTRERASERVRKVCVSAQVSTRASACLCACASVR